MAKKKPAPQSRKKSPAKKAAAPKKPAPEKVVKATKAVKKPEKKIAAPSTRRSKIPTEAELRKMDKELIRALNQRAAASLAWLKSQGESTCCNV